jgi:hypothetical protein
MGCICGRLQSTGAPASFSHSAAISSGTAREFLIGRPFSRRQVDVDHDRLVTLISALPSSPLYKPDLRQTPWARCCSKSSCRGKFSPLTGISLTVQKDGLLVKRLHRIRQMFEAITAFLIILSVGILAAHALDAFRHRT